MGIRLKMFIKELRGKNQKPFVTYIDSFYKRKKLTITY